MKYFTYDIDRVSNDFGEKLVNLSDSFLYKITNSDKYFSIAHLFF
jgi:hypothetical protein